MAKIDNTFNQLLDKILTEGKEYYNVKREVKRLQVASHTFRHEFKDGFPMLTSRKVPFKNPVIEGIWFLRGDNDIKYLRENNVNIWNKDAYNWYIKNGGTENYEEFLKLGYGSVGRNYSCQYRDFNGFDQIKYMIDLMVKDIMSSQICVSAWNPSELNQTALAPCHAFYQIIGIPNEGFELHWLQRSVDLYNGFPTNIASYAWLAKVLENITGIKALAIQCDMKCVHLYENAIEAAKEVLNREIIHDSCELKINRQLGFDFETWEFSDFSLIGYEAQPNISVEMLAPKSI